MFIAAIEGGPNKPTSQASKLMRRQSRRGVQIGKNL